MIKSVTIIGTGLIGCSVGLALREAGFLGTIAGWDDSASALDEALQLGAITEALPGPPGTAEHQPRAGVIVLAGPVLSTLSWMETLAPRCGHDTLITDVGSTKLLITEAARRLFNRPEQAQFLPGHPMAGKERSSPGLAEAAMFRDRMWLFTPVAAALGGGLGSELGAEWRMWVERFGARPLDLDAARHDELCAWVSHLPQMLATTLAAALEARFGDDAALQAIGGRALSEMTRLGASPFSMWRDVAHTNTEPIAGSLLALEQALAHLRDNLKTPELRELFREANAWCDRRRL